MTQGGYSTCNIETAISGNDGVAQRDTAKTCVYTIARITRYCAAHCSDFSEKANTKTASLISSNRTVGYVRLSLFDSNTTSPKSTVPRENAARDCPRSST